MEKAVQRARRITQQLLQVVKSQIMEMPAPTELTEVQLKELAEECVTLVETEAAHKGIEILVASQEADPRAWTDPYRLAQVLLNLLTNSIQATESGGRIAVILETTVEEARVVIRDTGCGISQENLTRVFEPFFTTKPVGGGTGMGLYVSWGIVNQLGGLISVESEPGKGTTFTITLPAKK
jgi:two-component system, NtrC family, sensor kinase